MPKQVILSIGDQGTSPEDRYNRVMSLDEAQDVIRSYRHHNDELTLGWQETLAGNLRETAIIIFPSEAIWESYFITTL